VISPVLPDCSICWLPIRIGDTVTITCVDFTPAGEPVLNYTHRICEDRQVDQLRRTLEVGE